MKILTKRDEQNFLSGKIFVDLVILYKMKINHIQVYSNVQNNNDREFISNKHFIIFLLHVFVTIPSNLLYLDYIGILLFSNYDHSES